MHNLPGRSVYLSGYRKNMELPAVSSAGSSLVFLSLHIPEEHDDSSAEDLTQLCSLLNERGFCILADIDPSTLLQFQVSSIMELKQKLGLHGVRLDYGFSEEEIISAAAVMPVVLNASTTSQESAVKIAEAGTDVSAMHNFYPRPETGLDREYLISSARMLKQCGLKVMAFIPGDNDKRGPLQEGLPTLEEHRHLPPSIGFIDLIKLGMDQVFIGDPGISDAELSIMETYALQDVIQLPCILDEAHAYLYHVKMHNRIDSPSWLIRAEESRQKDFPKHAVEQPYHPAERTRGSITIDNHSYGRYEHEIQLLRKDFPADARVNVIGHVEEKHIGLLDLVERGEAFELIPA